MRRALLICCSLCGAAFGSDWEALQQFTSQGKVRVYLKDGKTLTGPLSSWTSEAIVIQLSGQKSFRAAKPDVARVARLEKGSRGRGALFGATVGFGIGFAVGWFTAGRVADVNNPRVSVRLENVARFGPFGAGVGALIGALGSGTKEIIVYRSARSPRGSP